LKHLTESEIETCKDFFNSIDKDGDGAIDQYDLCSILKQLGEMPKKEDIDMMLRQVNKDNVSNDYVT